MEIANFYSVQDVSDGKFYKLPKILIEDPRFTGLSPMAIILYSVFLDRLSLSVRSGWVDKEGLVYINAPQQEVADLLRTSMPTIKRLYKELCDFHLIEVKKRGFGLTALIYLGKPTAAAEKLPYPEGTEPKEAEIEEESVPQEVSDLSYRSINPDTTEVSDLTYRGITHDTSEVSDLIRSMDNETEESETEYTKTKSDRDIKPKTAVKNDTSAKRFKPPSREEALAFVEDKHLNIDVDYFLDYYESNGWKVGRNPMKDWRATMRNWSRKKAWKTEGNNGRENSGNHCQIPEWHPD